MSDSIDSVLLSTARTLYNASPHESRVVVQRWARHASIAPFVNYRLCGEHSDEFAIEQPHVGEICLICHAQALDVGDLAAEHLSELTPNDTPESAMRKAGDLIAREKFIGFSKRLGAVRTEWQTTEAEIASIPTRDEREAREDEAFRHLRVLRKLRKDMVAEASTVTVGPLLVEADALKGTMERALVGDRQ